MPVDGGYTGAPFAGGVMERLKATVQVVKRNELNTFVVWPKRWIVERSFGCWKSAEGSGRTATENSKPACTSFTSPSSYYSQRNHMNVPESQLHCDSGRKPPNGACKTERQRRAFIPAQAIGLGNQRQTNRKRAEGPIHLLQLLFMSLPWYNSEDRKQALRRSARRLAASRLNSARPRRDKEA